MKNVTKRGGWISSRVARCGGRRPRGRPLEVDKVGRIDVVPAPLDGHGQEGINHGFWGKSCDLGIERRDTMAVTAGQVGTGQAK
jgi:hypothetical protein